jgi:hypothetical protein
MIIILGCGHGSSCSSACLASVRCEALSSNPSTIKKKKMKKKLLQ